MLDAVITKITWRVAWDQRVLIHTKTKDKAMTGEIVHDCTCQLLSAGSCVMLNPEATWGVYW